MNRHVVNTIEDLFQTRAELRQRLGTATSSDDMLTQVAAIVLLTAAVRAFAIDFVENIHRAGEGV